MEILIVPLFSTFSLELFRQLLLPLTISSFLPLVLSIPAAVRQKVEYRDVIYFHSMSSSHRKSSTFYISRYFIIGSNFFCSKLSNRLWCYIRLFCIICGIRCSIFIYLIHWKIWWGKIYFSFVAVEATCSIYETFYNWVIQEYESFSKNNFIILHFTYIFNKLPILYCNN